MNFIIKLIKIISIISMIFPLISCDIFTAFMQLQKMINAEKQVIGLLDHYLLIEEDRTSRLKNYKLYYDQLHSISSENVQHFLANPINANILIKRLTTDLERIMQSSCVDTSYYFNTVMNATFPTFEDFKGSADAIFRLQDTYKLETKSFANGIVSINNERKFDGNNSKDDKRIIMTSDDCFELGRHAYMIQDFYHMEIWMQEAMERLKIENPNDIASEIRILEFLSYASYIRGNFSQALELTKKFLILSPNNAIALRNIEIYSKWLEQYNLDVKENERVFISPEKTSGSSNAPETEKEIYESLCRGEDRLSDKIKSKLFCFYLNTDKIPYLRYTRIKVEEAFKRPQIVVFYDVISDSEIEVIKSLAEPKLYRSSVGSIGIVNHRISEIAWLYGYHHPVIANLERRIRYITGLDLTSAEPLQVVNYGIGGHYTPHFDYVMDGSELAQVFGKRGNRIATWLSYMNDVEAGGATIFTKLGVTIWPKKSSVAFWYNLLKSGDGDELTRHAACPVLIGSKWASNKWFHERGQEFRKNSFGNKNEFNIIQEV